MGERTLIEIIREAIEQALREQHGRDILIDTPTRVCIDAGDGWGSVDVDVEAIARRVTTAVQASEYIDPTPS